MSIRIQLLLFGLLGNILIAGVLYYASEQRATVEQEASGESLLVLYESAWYQTYNSTLERMGRWEPNYGERGEAVWNPDSDILSDMVETQGHFINPVLDSIKSRSLGNAQFLLEELFADDLDLGNLSFVMAYFPTGERIYCGSAFDLFGIDACSRNALPDFFGYLDTYIKEAAQRARQSTLKITDSSGKELSTLNQTFSFPVKVRGETLAIIVLGSDIRKALEVFEDEFEVRMGVQTPSGLISLDEDYSSENTSEENARFGIKNYASLVNEAVKLKSFVGSRPSEKAFDLGSSINLLPLSSYLSAEEAQLFIFKDEEESMIAANKELQNGLIYAAVIVLLVIALLTALTAVTFGGITRAIAVLKGLTEGDHSQQMPQRRGIFASDNDEVGELSSALQSYRGKLLELEDIRAEQASRRKERDSVIIEKMSHLADQLEGDAKTLILNDIGKMRELEKQETERGEEASVELMLLAFTRMSDEVNALINARTSEMEKARDEAIDAKGETSRFFANMSHELRTPLNAILGYGEMLAEDCEDLGYDDLLPDLKKITSAGTHLLSLINNILDISKIESGKMELYITSFEIEDVVDVIKDISAPLVSKNNNAFQCNIQDGIGAMRQDETKLRQCLSNLLSNAAKFTEAGTVTLEVDASLEKEIEMVSFKVIDTGEGMSEEGVGKVFEVYTQAERSTSAKHGGTGLGLPLSREMAQMMGGDITLTSELGVGSVFTLKLPRDCPQDEHEVSDSVLEGIDDDEKLVVLIDDDVTMHDLIKRTLNKIGLTLVGATDSEKGMQMVRETKPKLLLLDVLMPGRDGWSILRECKSDPELKDMPVIMVSQLNQDTLANSLGADDYITKPIDRELFLKTIKNILGDGDTDNNKILIIDDDENTRDLLSRMLKEGGWVPKTAKDGKEGLDQLGEDPALIVLDLEMPRMDGFEFLNQYIETVNEEDRCPILVYSGKDLTDVQKELLENNVEGLVRKDEVSMDELSAIVKEIYSSGKAEA
ncbi:MAG: response regulator [SAR86 cluster bacterium]|nr:response regulator [SAR86 cluster bacterium]